MPSPITHYVPQCAPREVARGRAACAWALAAAGAVAFAGLVFAAPWLAARGQALAAWVVYRGFAGVCHQAAERSFQFAGHPLAVCARCVGVYAGFAAGVVCYPLARGLRRTDAPARRWLVAALVPTTVDFLLGLSGLWENTHWSRALTGAVAGAGGALFAVPGLIELAADARPRGVSAAARVTEAARGETRRREAA